jgi:polypeptide N-acetylgalactosaminyltransferase
MLSPAGEIRRDEGCLDYSGGVKDMDQDNAVVVLGCHGQKGHQEWIYNEVCFIVLSGIL